MNNFLAAFRKAFKSQSHTAIKRLINFEKRRLVKEILGFLTYNFIPSV